MAALKDCVDQVVCILPGAAVLGIDEEDEVAEAEIAEQHSDRLHRFPEYRELIKVQFLCLNDTCQRSQFQSVTVTVTVKHLLLYYTRLQ